MNKIIEKTYELLDLLDDSDIIKNLVKYKDTVMNDKEVLDLVNRFNDSSYDKEMIDIKKELYKNNDYKNYMDNYYKLYNIVLKINNKYKKILGIRKCSV